MGVEVRAFSFSVLVRDYDKWSEVEQIHASYESEDFFMEELQDLMRTVGQAYMRQHPTIFVNDELV